MRYFFRFGVRFFVCVCAYVLVSSYIVCWLAGWLAMRYTDELMMCVLDSLGREGAVGVKGVRTKQLVNGWMGNGLLRWVCIFFFFGGFNGQSGFARHGLMLSV